MFKKSFKKLRGNACKIILIWFENLGSLYFLTDKCHLSSREVWETCRQWTQNFKHAFCYRAGLQPLCAQIRTCFEPILTLRDFIYQLKNIMKDKNTIFRQAV